MKTHLLEHSEQVNGSWLITVRCGKQLTDPEAATPFQGQVTCKTCVAGIRWTRKLMSKANRMMKGEKR